MNCPECQHRTCADYNNFRAISTLDGVFRLTLTIRRMPQSGLLRFLRPYRPEAELHFAWPYHEFGLDVMALVGRLRHVEHRSIPEIHRELTHRGLIFAERTVTNLLDRSDELRLAVTVCEGTTFFGEAGIRPKSLRFGHGTRPGGLETSCGNLIRPERGERTGTSERRAFLICSVRPLAELTL